LLTVDDRFDYRIDALLIERLLRYGASLFRSDCDFKVISMTLHVENRDSPGARGLYDPQFEKDSCGIGFIAQLRGVPSQQIVADALLMLRNMEHRGATGCEPNSGDGAGLLTALPHRFFERIAREELHTSLPDPGLYGVAQVFLPTDPREREICKSALAHFIAVQGQRLIGWRRVPTDPQEANLGQSAARTAPVIEQLLIGSAPGWDRAGFCRELLLIRKQAYHAIQRQALRQRSMYYVCSFSSRVIVYKGQLTSWQVLPFYPDLATEDFESHLAMVHSRFSTNTFPSWERAQPMRFMSHNGEINTLRGNRNWMRAREGLLRSELFGPQLERLLPVTDPETSDSGVFDNVLEMLLLAGRSLPEAIMIMIPEAWQNHPAMPEARRAFYEYHSCLMEPWDGPASVAFTDGRYIGAILDRNGLRPGRYYLTCDERIILASEVGTLPVEPENIIEKGRLEPGKMLLVDFAEGRLIPDEELKAQIASAHPYGDWLRVQRLELDQLPGSKHCRGLEKPTLTQRLKAFGYTRETLQFMLLPMVRELRDPIGSMGNDAALAVLSDQPRLLFDYFKQLFAQVTNPPIDPIREEIVMSLECYIGPERNLFARTPEHCRRLRLSQPLLTNEQLATLAELNVDGWKTGQIDTTWPATEGPAGLTTALQRIRREADAALDQGCTLLLLTDRNIGPTQVAIPSLLALGAVHQHLVRQANRTRVGLLVETGEAREVHHFSLLVGYGADAINPYLACESLWDAQANGLLPAEQTKAQLVQSYFKAAGKGLLKVLSKMGISTLQSYKGAQIFEALGLADEVVDLCFTGTSSRIQGAGFGVLAEEAISRHKLAWQKTDDSVSAQLPNPGEFHWRADGERHMWEPESIAQLQLAARTNSVEAYAHFARQTNEETTQKCALRGLLKLRRPVDRPTVPLEEVEPAAEIVKRFCTGAMSLGSISSEAHETLAIAMNRSGGKSNTGEGGESAERFQVSPDGQSRRSAIKQIASGRFGVTIDYLVNADELQIKMAQGAKPGEGGELPGDKVNEEIARIRHSTPGVGLISPPPHHDIYSIEDLKQLIYDLKSANQRARISVKLVSEVGVGTIAAGVVKAHAEHILISGDSGGTGASPLTSIKHAGLPWELGLAETHQTLVLNNLRDRVTLQADGQIKTGRDVIIAGLLGAEEIGFSTAPLITLGCIMMRKCHLNTCPVGIATQDPVLRQRFAGKPEHLVNYLFLVAEEVRGHLAELGFRRFSELVGRVDCLETDDAVRHWKADGLDLTPLLTKVSPANKKSGVVCVRAQDHGLERALDNHLLELSLPAIERCEPVRASVPIQNTDRAVGAILSSEIARRHGPQHLPDETIDVTFSGSAGQSFGAWLARGVTFRLVGDANDYVGKGLSGGRIIVMPPPQSRFAAEEQVIAGNVILYGATSGEIWLRGQVAERFAVRNSGALAVVEGCGDHGCEYMTGGCAVVLGPTGRNFAAGMSGGIALVWDPDQSFLSRCNLGSVELENLSTLEEQQELEQLLKRHFALTGSTRANELLAAWPTSAHQFVRVMPRDYKRVLGSKRPRLNATWLAEGISRIDRVHPTKALIQPSSLRHPINETPEAI
jgi:glutamate synthase (NADPH/NADH) large chain